MKKNMEKAIVSNKSNKISNKANNNVTNSNSQSNNNIGFDKTNGSKSFHYDENSEHSFELRDCK